MGLLQQLQMLSHYCSWANERQMIACTDLPDEERRRNFADGFGSLHGLLNHMVIADQLWLSRCLQRPFDPPSLNAIMFEDFAELRRARQVADGEYVDLLAGMTDEDVARTLRFTSRSRQQEMEMPVASIFLHAFNHQTYHRGQVSMMIKQAGAVPPATDLFLYPGAS